jgi:hypothetical protein
VSDVRFVDKARSIQKVFVLGLRQSVLIASTTLRAKVMMQTVMILRIAFASLISSVGIPACLCIFLIAFSGLANAAECTFEIDRQIVSAGACELDGGSGKVELISFKYENVFIYLLISSEIDDASAVAEGWWNNYEGHAHDSLGQLKYSHDCWTGDRVKLCIQK